MSVKLTFGLIKEVYNNIATDQIARKTKDAVLFRRYVKSINENQILKTLFMIHYNIENKIESNRELAREFVKENLNLMSQYKKKDIKTTLSKLATPVIKEHSAPNYVGSSLEKLHDNISVLIFSNTNPLMVESKVTSRENIVDHILENKVKVVKESYMPNSILAATLVNKFNETYDNLDESERTLITNLLEADAGSKEKLLNEIIGECTNLIDSHLENTTEDTKDKLVATKEKLSESTFNETSFLSDLTKVYQLRKSLII